jgi:hypothetical protein
VLHNKQHRACVSDYNCRTPPRREFHTRRVPRRAQQAGLA